MQGVTEERARKKRRVVDVDLKKEKRARGLKYRLYFLCEH